MKVLDIGVRYDLRDVEREIEMPPETPVVVRQMTDEERRRYGPPARPTRAEVVERLRRGMTAEQIAREFRCSLERVKKIAQVIRLTAPAAGAEQKGEAEVQEAMQEREQQEARTSEEAAVIPARPALPSRPEVTREAIEAAINQGETNEEICRRFAISKSTLYTRMKEWGLLAGKEARRRARLAASAAAETPPAPAGGILLEVSQVAENDEVQRIFQAAAGLVETLGGRFNVTVTVRRVAG